MTLPRLRRAAGQIGILAVAFLLAEGCAESVHISPPDYGNVSGKGTLQIATRDGRVYDLNGAAVDSSRFVGQVDVIRNVVGRDGHIEALETTEEVRLPFDDVLDVTLKRSDLPGTALLVAGMIAGLTILIRSFQPADQGGSGGTTPPPGGTPDGKGSRH